MGLRHSFERLHVNQSLHPEPAHRRPLWLLVVCWVGIVLAVSIGLVLIFAQ